MENSKRIRLSTPHLSLLLLPNELLLEIFRYVSISTAHLSLGITCRRLHQVSVSPLLWKRTASQIIQLPQSAIPKGPIWRIPGSTEKVVLGQRRSSLARYPFEDEDPEGTGTMRSDVDSDGRKEVLDFLFEIHGSWREVVKSFCPKASFWAPLSLLGHSLIVTDGQEDDSVLCSKIGGTPFLFAEESWPRCEACSSEMVFFFQLNLTSGDPAHAIPGAARRLCEGSLIQFFCCCEGEDYLGRILASDEVERPHKSVSDLESIVLQQKPLVKPLRIIGFRTFLDYPQPFADPLVRILFLKEFGRRGFKERETIENRETNWEDKVFGWPCFVQDDETPNCVMCGERMILIFQIASCGLFAQQSWGDGGIGHVFGCQECENSILRFRWACG